MKATQLLHTLGQSVWLENITLGHDHLHQALPELHEGSGPVFLVRDYPAIEVASRVGKLGEHLFTIAAIRRQNRAELLMPGSRRRADDMGVSESPGGASK